MVTITSPVLTSNLARKTIHFGNAPGNRSNIDLPVNHAVDSVVLNTQPEQASFLKPEVFKAHGLSIEETSFREANELKSSLHYKKGDYPHSFTEAAQRYQRVPLPEAFTDRALEGLENITRKLYKAVRNFRQLSVAEQNKTIEKWAASGDDLVSSVQTVTTPLKTMSEEKVGQVIRRFAEMTPELIHKIDSNEQFDQMAEKIKAMPKGRASDAELGRAVRNLIQFPVTYAKAMQKFQAHQLKQLEQQNPEFAKLLQDQDKMHKIWVIKDKDHAVAGSLLMTNLQRASQISPETLIKTDLSLLKSHVFSSVGLSSELSQKPDLAASIIDNFVHHAKQMNKSELWIAAPSYPSFHNHLMGKVKANPISPQDIQKHLPMMSLNAIQAYLSGINLINVKLYHVKL